MSILYSNKNLNKNANKSSTSRSLIHNEALIRLQEELSKQEKKQPIKTIMKKIYEASQEDETKNEIKELRSKDHEKLISFGQLLVIKREKMCLRQYQVKNQLKISSLCHYEVSKYYPTNENMEILKKFYNITQEELESCKDYENLKNLRTYSAASKYKKIKTETLIIPEPEIVLAPPKINISHIISILKNIEEDVNVMDEEGILAKSLKKDSQDHLIKIIEMLTDILILDKIL